MKIQQLFEALTSPYPFIVTKDTSNVFVARFGTSDGFVEFEAIRSLDDKGGNTFEISFNRENKSIELRRYATLELSGQGDQFKIFATILELIKLLIKKYSPNEITFTAEKLEHTRVRFYKRLLQKYVPSGYESLSDSNLSDYRVYFFLRKKNLDELSESLKSTYPFSVYKNTDGEFSAKFKTADGEVNISAVTLAATLNGDKTWDLAFSRSNSVGAKQFKLTNQGDQFKIFATIIEFIKELIKQRSPDSIKFSADRNEYSRVSLYKKMIDKNLPEGYEVRMHNERYDTEFVLERQK